MTQDFLPGSRPTQPARSPGADEDWLYEASPDPRCVLDADARLERANQALAELCGCASGGLVGRDLDALFVEQGRAEIAQALTEARAGGTGEFETRLRTADGPGPVVWWRLVADPDGRVHAAGRPVTHGRRLQRLLAETQRTAAIGGWEWDLLTDELFWTDETYRLHEVDPSTYRPTIASAVRFYTTESLPRITAAVEAGQRHGIPWDLELQIVTAGGHTRDVRAVGHVERHDGEPVRIYGAFQDITDRRLLEEQLHHAQKLEGIGRLAGGVAHDFNNLLTVILGNLDLVAGSGAGEAAAVSAIRAAAEQACHVTGQLLAFARKRVRAPEPIALGRRVLELTDLLRPLVGEQIALEIDVPGGEAVVLMDPGHLELVLVNLVVNARDAMPAGGRVSLLVREGPQEVELKVTDTGTGIDPEHLPKLFEPFFTTKDPDRGTGLGLATCHGIVEQNGGAIRVESQLGRGTTFRITFPRDSGAGLPVVEVEPSPRQVPAPACRTILLVEDEALVRDLVRQLLEREGYRVLVAEDCERALALLDEAGAVDAILTDLVLPGVGGRGVIRAVRELLGPVPALLMSGYHDEALDTSPLEAGEAFLEKPFTARQLAESVAGLFGEPSLR